MHLIINRVGGAGTKPLINSGPRPVPSGAFPLLETGLRPKEEFITVSPGELTASGCLSLTFLPTPTFSDLRKNLFLSSFFQIREGSSQFLT